MTTPFPVVALSGTAWQRGRQHGRALADRIRRTLALYTERVFAASRLDPATIEQRSIDLAERTAAFDADLVEEMEGIAEGAGLEPWQIFALNARTEILNGVAAECTSAWFPVIGLLGQTWDWIRELEDLVVVLDVSHPGGLRVVTLTEPGMLAKIGMNGHGLGVCLNILLCEHALDGVPIHLTLRAVMQAESVAEAESVLERSGRGKASHVLVGHADGEGFGLEFAGGRTARLEPEDGVLLHTNHCIGSDTDSVVLPTSAERFQEARRWMSEQPVRDLEAMQRMLLDDRFGPLSIQSSYRPEPMLGGLEIGTCATVIMDLPGKTMRVRKGPGAAPDFVSISLA